LLRPRNAADRLMAREVVSVRQAMNFGPAMTALTEMQRNFVFAYNNAGGKNSTEAARAAGYADTINLKRTAFDLLRNPAIQAAIREDIGARFTADLPATLERINDIASDAGHTKQFDALKLKLHHGGMIEKTVHEHQHTHVLTYEQKVDELKRLAAITGDDPNEVLAGIVDADATELTPDDPEFW
jgi:hypothetical protein